MTESNIPDLHVVLVYNGLSITATLYNKYNEANPSSTLAYTFVSGFPTYQWFKDGVLDPSVTTDTYSVTAPTCSDEYKVIVTYEVNNITVTSATLTHDVIINDVVSGNIVVADSLTKALTINGNVDGTITLNGTSPSIASTGALTINSEVYGAATVIHGDIAGLLISGSATDHCKGTSFTISSALAITGTFISYQSITVSASPGALTISGTLINHGSFTSNGSTSVSVGGTFNNDGTISVPTGGTLDTSGSMVNSGIGTITISGTGTFTNNGTFVELDTSSIIFSATVASLNSASIILHHNSVLNISSPTLSNEGTAASIVANGSSSINLTGTGTLVNGDGISLIGTIILNERAYLTMQGASTVLTNSASPGQGTITLNNDSSVNINGSSGSINDGVISITSRASFNLYGISTFLVQIDASASISNAGHLNIYDGAEMDIFSGTISNSGTLNVFPGSNLAVPGPVTPNLPIGAGTVNGSTVDTTSANTISGVVIGITSYVSPNFANTNLYGASVGSLTNMSTINFQGNLTYPQPMNPFVPNSIVFHFFTPPINAISSSVKFEGIGSLRVLGSLLDPTATSLNKFFFSNLPVAVVPPVCPSFTAQSYTVTQSIVIGTNFIIDNSLISVGQPAPNGNVNLVINVPGGVMAANYQWAYNYKIFSPAIPVDNIIVNGNGIYEVSFQDVGGSTNGFTYYAIVEITDSTPAAYIKIMGDDGNLYGTIVGFPSVVNILTFSAVDAKQPVRFRIYVNNYLASTAPTLPVAGLVAGDQVLVVAIDCCGLFLHGNTFKLACPST